MTGWWRRLTRPASPRPPLQIVRLTYTIDILRGERASISVETRLRGVEDGLTGFRQILPTAGPVERLQSSLGEARAAGLESGHPAIDIVLPAPLARAEEVTHLLSLLLTAPFPEAAPALIIRPLYPVAAIGLSLIFPLTRPPRSVAIRAGAEPESPPDPTPLQSTPRADSRAAYVWLKEAPPAGETFRLTWTW